MKINSEYNKWISFPLRYKIPTVLIMAFVVGGMMFLVSAVTEEAMGRTTGYVLDWSKFKNYNDPHACCYSELKKGEFVSKPTVNGNDQITWTTKGPGLWGDEEGYYKPPLNPVPTRA